jgi:hypothetical protein
LRVGSATSVDDTLPAAGTLVSQHVAICIIPVV